MNIFPKQGPRTYRILRKWFSRMVNQFESSVNDPMSAQKKVLKELTIQTQGTLFAKDHQLTKNMTLHDYRDAVPIRDFEQLSPWMDRVIAGEPRVLTRDPVMSFVETSGTQSTPKWIPVTKSWSKHIKNAQTLWVLGILKDFPMVEQGHIFHLVSSPTEKISSTGLPVGANTGRMAQELPSIFQQKFVMHNLPQLPDDQDLRHYIHLRLALDVPITGWVTANPSTVALYARKFKKYQEWLAQDMHKGTLREGPAKGLSSDVRDELERRIHSRPVPMSWELAHTWPLAMIGCWTGGPAQYFTQQFPQLLGAAVPVRDVGITASEGYYALPLHSDWDGGVLWTQGELLEFEDRDGQIFWSWELETGKQYSLITSGKNGLFRYRMQDLVEVTGFYQGTPIIRFVGKQGRYLNATGEKVTEGQLSLAIVNIQILVAGYTGFIQMGEVPFIEVAVEPLFDIVDVSELELQLDKALQEVSVEYQSKRYSQRLGALKIRYLSQGTYERFRNFRISQGATESQVKDCVIAKDQQEWQRILNLST